MFLFPNRMASIKQLRSEAFIYLNKHNLSTERLKSEPVHVLQEVRANSDKYQFGYRLNPVCPNPNAAQLKSKVNKTT